MVDQTVDRLGNKFGAGPWANVDLPENGDLLVVLWRKPGGVGWKAVRSLVTEEGKAPHAVSIANLTPAGLALIHGEEKMMLAVGRPLIRSLPANEVVPFQIGLPVVGSHLSEWPQ